MRLLRVCVIISKAKTSNGKIPKAKTSALENALYDEIQCTPERTDGYSYLKWGSILSIYKLATKAEISN